ncbi:hypothetical protein [Sphingobium yanoikuyae]|uniref:hypothetical protein n=1 Tax=Sphingobium yanoikuyae TaxID=13690 RepID=UPI0022DDC58C|nr:hypothetical protein [Sphingobium yanoikuyae]WBQ15056.1 hypothetical protein PAE53_14080 [Sphingobium yanoikuyae]
MTGSKFILLLVEHSGLPTAAKLLMKKARNFPLFTRGYPEMLDFEELGRLVLYH